jgi:organic hydroperoxide reductase OsmC/OhrA
VAGTERVEAAEGEETTHHARIVWRGGKDDLRAHEITVAGQTLAASSAAALGGDASKADPEELFVAALSSCHMLWFLDLSRAERLRVSSYEDVPEGTMDGTRFTRVVLRPLVEFEQEADPASVEALHHAAHERCFIANSVSCPVEVEPR